MRHHRRSNSVSQAFTLAQAASQQLAGGSGNVGPAGSTSSNAGDVRVRSGAWARCTPRRRVTSPSAPQPPPSSTLNSSEALNALQDIMSSPSGDDVSPAAHALGDEATEDVRMSSGGAGAGDDHGAQEQQQEQERGLDASFFPAPSHYYKRYTDDNLAMPMEAVIAAETGKSGGESSFKRSELEPPDVDWVMQNGSYSVFGEVWPIDETLPTLQDIGVEELFTRGQDRARSLQTLLHAMLLTYHSLVTALLAPPPSLAALPPPGPNGEPPTDPERYVERLRLISINMHHLINELRPVQARETLKAMMRAQIDQRKAKTAAIKQKCVELSEALANLSTDLNSAASSVDPVPPSVFSSYDDKGRATMENEAIKRLRDKVDALGS